MNESVQRKHQQHGTDNDHQPHDRHGETEDMQGQRGPQFLRVYIETRSVHQHDRVLQHDRGPERRHHGRKPVGLAQGAIRHPLQRHAERRHHEQHEQERQRHGRGRRQTGRQPARGQERQTKIRPDGEQIAVREVDELQHSVHHGVPKGHQGIDAAHGQPVGQLLEEFIHPRGPSSSAARTRPFRPLRTPCTSHRSCRPWR